MLTDDLSWRSSARYCTHSSSSSANRRYFSQSLAKASASSSAATLHPRAAMNRGKPARGPTV